jgi:hypothetical protein
MHFEHEPAEVMMVDFAGDNLSYVDKIRQAERLSSAPFL